MVIDQSWERMRRRLLSLASIGGGLALAVLGFLAAPAQSSSAEAGDTTTQAFLERINELARRRDLDGLLATVSEILPAGVLRCTTDQATQAAEAVGVFTSRDFGDRSAEARRHGRRIALDCLGRMDPATVPVAVRLDLAIHLDRFEDAAGRPLERDPFRELRRTYANQLVSAWKQLLETIDRNWKPPSVPLPMYPAPPPGANGAVSPSGVKDPAVRAAWEKAIEDHHKLVERNNEQVGMRTLEAQYVPFIERLLVAAYRTEPREAEEIKKLLDSLPAGAEANRDRVLKAIID